jgi:methanogenic corrinoid protein MtbC1
VPGRYPIRAVAKITGLSLDTLRAWERRYQAVVPERSDRGREYGPKQIERLLQLGRLVQKGHAIGRIASLSDAELSRLLNDEPVSTSEPKAAAPDLLRPVLEAVDSFDSARASDELSRLAAVMAPRDLVYQVAIPLMREIGIGWHEGTLAIAQEHLVSQILRNLLGGMMRLFRPQATAARIVMTTPAGELHDFGILAAAMLASLAGLDVVCLGPNLPAREIAQTAGKTRARIVSLGITLPSEAAVAEIGSLADQLSPSAELWIGGGAAETLNLTGIARPVVRLKSLQSFETECRRFV